MYVDRAQIPSSPLQPTYADDNKAYVEAYHTLFSGAEIYFLNQGNRSDRFSYPRGHCLYVLDLTLDLSAR